MSNVEQSAGRSLADRVIKATVAIAVAHAMAKIFGLLQARIIGGYYGFEGVNDAFLLVFDGILMTLFLIGEESFGPAFLPVFMDAKDNESEEAAWRFSSILLNLQILLLMAAVALLMIYPQRAIAWFSMFGSDAHKAAAESRADLAAGFLKSMSPALLGLSLGSLTYMILNGYKKFFWPAFADAASKAALVAGVLAGDRLGLSKDALVVGVLAAGATKIVVHLLALAPKLRRWSLRVSFQDPYVRRFLILVAPLVVGILFAKMRDFFNNCYVPSNLEEGMLSTSIYGKKIFNAVHALIPYPLSIALFPFFCELVDRDDRESLGAALTKSTRMLLLIFLPLTVVLMAVSIPLAQAFYQTGKVTAENAMDAGRVSTCYLIAMPFYALECIYMQAYFSTRRMISLTVIGVVFSSVSIAISALGVLYFGVRDLDAVMLVALGYSLSRALKLIALVGLLKWQKLPVLPLGPTVGFLSRALLMTVLCGGAAYGVLYGLDRVLPAEQVAQPDTEPGAKPVSNDGPAKSEAALGDDSLKAADPSAPRADAAKGKPASSGRMVLLTALPRLVLPGLAALIVFFATCRLLRLGELNEIIAFAREKLRRKGKGPKVKVPSV
jgi:murein biosynthesis integral membrane protein MurJ